MRIVLAHSHANTLGGGERAILELARGAMLPEGGFLLVGADGYRLIELREAILGAFGWGLTVTILLAVIGGATLSAGFLRRIDEITSDAVRIAGPRPEAM